jgi:hypothetical protein
MKLKFTELMFSDPSESTCKGIVCRYRNKAFTTRAGVRRVEDVQELKRQSCPGCTRCGGIRDMLREFPDLLEIDAKVTDGDLVYLSLRREAGYYRSEEDGDCHVLASRVA